MRIPRDFGVAEGNVQGDVGKRGCIRSEAGLDVRALLRAETKIMPPQFTPVFSVETERQECLSSVGVRGRCDEDSIPINDR